MCSSDLTFAGNSAGTSGGGLRSGGRAPLVVTSCTFSGNSADLNGGGICLALLQSAVLNNSIVANSPSGSDVAMARDSGTVSGGHNLIETIRMLGGTNKLTDTITAAPKLGPLADNGGPTQTMALLPGSAAIDAGDNALVPAGLSTDQRGRGYARISGRAVDLGAFEV